MSQGPTRVIRARSDSEGPFLLKPLPTKNDQFFFYVHVVNKDQVFKGDGVWVGGLNGCPLETYNTTLTNWQAPIFN